MQLRLAEPTGGTCSRGGSERAKRFSSLASSTMARFRREYDNLPPSYQSSKRPKVEIVREGWFVEPSQRAEGT
jgi:hypothetical protein